MGTWGPGSFENDHASDWVFDLEESDGLPFLEQSIEAVAALGDDYLEAHVAESAIAAAETLACLRGRPGKNLTESLENWLAANSQDVPSGLLQRAQAALERVQRPPSELLELWEESAEFSNWQDSMQNLVRRLKG